MSWYRDVDVVMLLQRTEHVLHCMVHLLKETKLYLAPLSMLQFTNHRNLDHTDKISKYVVSLLGDLYVILIFDDSSIGTSKRYGRTQGMCRRG